MMTATDATLVAAGGGFAGLDTSTWIALLSLVVAAIAIPITVWATRYWGERRARILVVVVSVPILPEQAGNGPLEVSFHHIPVTEPHLVTVALRNIGPRDLASEMFDGGQPIAIAFDQTFYGLTEVRGGANTLAPGIGSSGESAVVRIKPALLKRDAAWGFTAVTSGPVEVTVNAPLVDTDIEESRPQSLDAERPDITVRLALPGLAVAFPISALRLSRKRR